MSDEIKTLLDYVWVPFVGYIMFLIRGHRSDNKERDKEQQDARERIAILEFSRDKQEENFQRLEAKVDKIYDYIQEIAKNLPKRSGD